MAGLRFSRSLAVAASPRVVPHGITARLPHVHVVSKQWHLPRLSWTYFCFFPWPGCDFLADWPRQHRHVSSCTASRPVFPTSMLSSSMKSWRVSPTASAYILSLAAPLWFAFIVPGYLRGALVRRMEATARCWKYMLLDYSQLHTLRMSEPHSCKRKGPYSLWSLCSTAA